MEKDPFHPMGPEHSSQADSFELASAETARTPERQAKKKRSEALLPEAPVLAPEVKAMQSLRQRLFELLDRPKASAPTQTPEAPAAPARQETRLVFGLGGEAEETAEMVSAPEHRLDPEERRAVAQEILRHEHVQHDERLVMGETTNEHLRSVGAAAFAERALEHLETQPHASVEEAFDIAEATVIEDFELAVEDAREDTEAMLELAEDELIAFEQPSDDWPELIPEAASTEVPDTPAATQPLPADSRLPYYHQLFAPEPTPNEAMQTYTTGGAETSQPAATPERLKHRKYQRTVDLLTGGIVGYLIARRRTEARLLPLQHALEKEVKALKQDIGQRQEKMQKLTDEKVRAEGHQALQLHTEKIRERAHQRERNRHAARAAGQDPMLVRYHSTPAPERAPHALRQKEVNQPLATTEHVVTVPLVATETVQPKPVKAEKLPLPDLLQVAGHLRVEGTTVRTLYEQGRLSQKEVREVVQAHGNHHTYERVLGEKLRIAKARESLEFLPREPSTQVVAAGQATALHQVQPPSVTPEATMPERPGAAPTQSQHIPVKSHAKASKPPLKEPIVWVTATIAAAVTIALIIV